MKMHIAKGLIELGAVKLSPHKPFLYASGLKGPIYCDNRLILSHINFRTKVIESFIDLLRNSSLNFDTIGGIATAGIPHAAFLADRLQRKMIYIRPKKKDHGKAGQVEGAWKPGETVLLVEDLVNQGSSLADTVKAIHEVNLTAKDCLAIVDYQMTDAKRRLESLDLKLHSLTDFDHLVKAGCELGFINDADKNILIDWHNDPKKWSESQFK